MGKLMFIVALILLWFNVKAFAIDSLYTGRVCKIILTYGFEAEGTITKVHPDTVWLSTKYKELGIPVRDIKFVLEPGAEPSEETEVEQLKVIEAPKIDSTDECGVYLSSSSVLKNV